MKRFNPEDSTLTIENLEGILKRVVKEFGCTKDTKVMIEPCSFKRGLFTVQVEKDMVSLRSYGTDREEQVTLNESKENNMK